MDAVALALVLALDAAAVAAARAVSGVRPREAAVMAVAFGGFQGGMAAIGWGIGAAAARWISTWDHWVAFGVLALLGARMTIAALRADGDDEPIAPLSARLVVLLAIATSLDALAAGITLPLLSVAPWLAITLITGITAGLTLLGARTGAALGTRIGRRLEIVGGLALCGIGVKILLEHL